MKRCLTILLAFFILCSNSMLVFACDDSQSQNHTAEILFGEDALKYSSNDSTKILFDAIYICCEQSDGQGKDRLNNLKKKRVSRVPDIAAINIKYNDLIKCSHRSWESIYSKKESAQDSRKNVLRSTVNKVFDFGIVNNLFGKEKGKCNSMSALLYYVHILSDYLADDPEDTAIIFKGKSINPFCGQPYIEINGGRPTFTQAQKQMVESFVSLSSFDSMGRSGVAFANLGVDTLAPPGSRQNIGHIYPSGWSQEKYVGVVNSDPPFVYNRCHLIAHQLANRDDKNNLITGTRFLNEAMLIFEDRVADYIKNTSNHVLYRVTPIYENDNKVASGVQIEAYSVEDKGEGISFNVYCYNVQPGVNINYLSGKNELADMISTANEAIPFAVINPSDSNPDLIYEINKHLELLFGGGNRVSSDSYSAMMSEINTIASEARGIGNLNDKPAQIYIKNKQCEFRYLSVLKTYIPKLLKEEDFFVAAFD